MSNVYFIDFKKQAMNLDLLKKPLDRVKASKMIAKSDIVALKMHFGEMGNTAYIKPAYINYLCSYFENIGGKVFITDTNTLYKGMRSNSVDHLNNAFFNGFGKFPIVIADGMRGESFVEVAVNGEFFKKLYIASDIYYADAIICVTHFKGHELTGFGGALKNMGMGCAARKGKLAMHSNIGPSVNTEKCIGCMECAKWCASKAIDRKEKKAVIDPKRCVGCGLCIDICKARAIRINWTSESSEMQKKMAEYAEGAVKKGKTIYINIINDVSPACDCYSYNGPYLVDDVGILVSDDIVSVDSASYDLVNKRAGKNIFKAVHKEVDPTVQLEHAEKMGLGEREYTIVPIS
ncbi:MAG: DUF362 domain-containing protein [bacterium]|nr:DUF362 domain-containing protein [bacterium]